jgi:hypothetical protein
MKLEPIDKDGAVLLMPQDEKAAAAGLLFAARM